MISYLCIFYSFVKCFLAQSSLQNIFHPADGVRSGTNILINQIISSYKSNYTITYPSDVTYVATPHFFVGICDLHWGQMSLKISTVIVYKNSAVIYVNIPISTYYLKITYFLADSDLIQISSSCFILDSPKTNTNFPITNHKDYQVILLQTFIYEILQSLTSPTPNIILNQYFSKSSMSVSIDVSSQMQITELQLQMFKIDHIKVLEIYPRFGVVITVATNTNNSLWDNYVYYQSSFSGYYFAGLHLLERINQDVSTLHKFFITQQVQMNADAYFSQIMNILRFCPIQFPYFNQTLFKCLTDCGDYQYPNKIQQCQYCNPVCKRCQITPQNCSSCESSMILIQVQSTTQYPSHICGCEQGKFINWNPLPQCLSCPNNCRKCATSTSCIECYPSLYFDFSTLECKCRGTFINHNGVPKCITKKIQQKCKQNQQISPLLYSCELLIP